VVVDLVLTFYSHADVASPEEARVEKGKSNFDEIECIDSLCCI
jgi:hypothetical protein